MVVRDEVHKLVDLLSESELTAARHYLETLHANADPLKLVLESAPIDDEPVTDEEESGAAEAREQYLRGETRSLDEVMRFLALFTSGHGVADDSARCRSISRKAGFTTSASVAAR